MLRCLLAIVVVVFLGTPPVSASEPRYYYWSISDTPDDPFDNTTVPWVGSRVVYLWFNCGYPGGLSAAQMRLESSGLEPVAFTPAGGIVQHGTLPDLDLSLLGCPYGPNLMGTLLVEDATGGGGWICASATRSVQDCDTVLPYPFGFAGLGSGADAPCDEQCSLDFVLPGAWGKVKALYRP